MWTLIPNFMHQLFMGASLSAWVDLKNQLSLCIRLPRGIVNFIIQFVLWYLLNYQIFSTVEA